MIGMYQLLILRQQKLAFALSPVEIAKLFARSNHNHIGRMGVNTRILHYNCTVQNELMQRAFTCHSKIDSDDNHAPSKTSIDDINLKSLTTSDERHTDQLGHFRSQKPSERFDSNRSDLEWEQLHCELIKKNSLEVMDVIHAEQCMRWWISQGRSCVRVADEQTRNQRVQSRRQNGDTSTATTNKKQAQTAIKAIVSALDLFGRVVLAIDVQPELLRCDEMDHWYDGRLPKATHVLNAILDAWRLCWIGLAVYDDNKNLPTPQTMFTLLKDNWSDFVPMNERTYATVMHSNVATMNSHCNATVQYQTPIFCEEVLNFMLERKLPKNVSEHARPLYAENSTLPDNIAYATALNAWARSGRADAAKRAEILFNQFTSLCNDGTLPTMPNTYCYNTLLVALSTPPVGFADQRLILLKCIKSTEQQIDQAMVDNVLHRENSLLLAEDMFRSMQHCAYPNVMPNTVSFRTLIFAWAEYSVDLRYVDRNKSRNAMDRAITILYEMVQLRVDSGNTTIDIDCSFFGKIISTLALNQPQVLDDVARSDLHLAEEVYQYMLNLYRKTREKRFTPDITLLCAMTLVYAKDDRPFEAEAILTRLENEARSRNKLSELPRVSYYRDTLDAFFHFASKEAKGGKQDSACIAADKAESLILRMIDIAFVTDNEKNVPDRRIINNMLELWIMCQTPQRAENYYRCIESLYEATQCRNLSWKPIHIRRLLTAWVNKGDACPIFAAEQAENILQEMQRKYEQSNDARFQPNVASISLVISAWLRTGHSERVAKCKRLFNDAMAAYDAGNAQARPDTALYGSVFKAYSTAGDGQGAMNFLETMNNDYSINSNLSAKPTIGIYNMVLLTWLKSTDPNAPNRAVQVFEMIQAIKAESNLKIEPDHRTFSILCEILASTKGEGFEEQYKFFQNQLEKTKGDNQTYKSSRKS